MAVPSSTSNSERPIPDLPWRGLLVAVLALAAAATAGWEIRCRAAGYAPTLNDTTDLWAQQREKVRSESIVIIGDSRALFDLDLDVLELGLGSRPLQLALPGSCGYPMLENLAADENFRGTVISSLIPLMWLAPPSSPPYQNSLKALARHRTWSPAQRWSHHLGVFLEERLAFLQQEDLTLSILLQKIPLPERAGFQAPPALPPYFQTMDRERRTRMTESCARPGPLQDRVRDGWLPLFTPPPPPRFIPPEAFARDMAKAIEQRFADTAAAVRKIQARGGKVVFVRFPFTGQLKELEDRLTPRAGPWTRIISESGASGIYFEDHPELLFDCPEWSHLSGPDSVEFSKRLVPHLQAALTDRAE